MDLQYQALSTFVLGLGRAVYLLGIGKDYFVDFTNIHVVKMDILVKRDKTNF